PGRAEACNGVDDDCNGVVDDAGPALPWYPDADGDGYGASDAEQDAPCAPDGAVAVGGDCDDGDASVNPAAAQLACAGVDQDCDGVVDDLGDPTTWYPDADGDGHGAESSGTTAYCAPGDGWVAASDDCDDADRERWDVCPEPRAAPTGGCGCDA